MRQRNGKGDTYRELQLGGGGGGGGRVEREAKDKEVGRTRKGRKKSKGVMKVSVVGPD